eukprot:TRINITY_DN120732_c0_g1_i1.p5 TRINITY_DN120732_c0_g1~~TRINITY_DN120732_c0_g1_i1.p5  ORF type:complete len:117 (+),score=21.07 TRINITY_DN120732_c0_g1_i1:1077-1427(+)
MRPGSNWSGTQHHHHHSDDEVDESGDDRRTGLPVRTRDVRDGGYGTGKGPVGAAKRTPGKDTAKKNTEVADTILHELAEVLNVDDSDFTTRWAGRTKSLSSECGETSWRAKLLQRG